MRTAYLGGPMRGIPGSNFPAFHEAALRLRASGWQVWSPAEHDIECGFDGTDTLTYSDDDMRSLIFWDLERIADADHLILLPGWEKSVGCAVERGMARFLRKAVHLYDRESPLCVRPLVGQIIGISGYARSGKDTVAAALVANHGFTRIGFADALKALAYGMNPIVSHGTWVTTRMAPLVDQVGWEEAKKVPEVRQLLQRLGTEGGRKVMPGIWVEALFKQAAGIPKLVVPDVRFPDEADGIRARGGQVWRIHRPGVEAANGHVSETALDGWDFDFFITNNGTLDDIDPMVAEIMASA